jgi:hypothetical protein
MSAPTIEADEVAVEHETPAVATVIVDAPGLYSISESAYHLDPVPGGSLSASGAKRLLECPAKFRWEQTHPVHKSVYDLGHAAHKYVLNEGADIREIDAANYLTKAAKEAKKDAYAAGMIPLLTHEHETVKAMAAMIRRHPIASILFDPANGTPEQSIFWFDEEFGVMRRSRLDWLPNPQSNGRLIIVDYKSAASADPNVISRSVASFDYHMQDDTYREAVQAVGLGGDDTAFLFVFQERTPPYLVTVVELDAEARQVGHERNRRALEIYRDCSASGYWPGYSDSIELISLPKWATYQHAKEDWS